MSDDQLSDNGMDEEDNFDFLIKRTQEKTNKLAEDFLGANGQSLEVQQNTQLRASTVYVKKSAPVP